jgi:hypothetical protein
VWMMGVMACNAVLSIGSMRVFKMACDSIHVADLSSRYRCVEHFCAAVCIHAGYLVCVCIGTRACNVAIMRYSVDLVADVVSAT